MVNESGIVDGSLALYILSYVIITNWVILQVSCAQSQAISKVVGLAGSDCHNLVNVCRFLLQFCWKASLLSQGKSISKLSHTELHLDAMCNRPYRKVDMDDARTLRLSKMKNERHIQWENPHFQLYCPRWWLLNMSWINCCFQSSRPSAGQIGSAIRGRRRPVDPSQDPLPGSLLESILFMIQIQHRYSKGLNLTR